MQISQASLDVKGFLWPTASWRKLRGTGFQIPFEMNPGQSKKPEAGKKL